MPAAVELLKEEEKDFGVLLLLLRVLRKVCCSYYAVVPAVESVLAATTSLLKRVSKKKVAAEEASAVLEFVLMLESQQPFVQYCMEHYTEVCMVEGCERQTYAGLATHLVKIAQKALKDCDMSALIESFEGFEQRRLKDLANAPSETESDEEDAHDEEVVARVLFCLQAVVVNTAQCTLSSEQRSAFCKGSRRQLRSHIDVLTQVVELLQAMIEEPCGEALYAFAIQTMASCVPIYGRMGLFVDQVRIAHAICASALPDLKPTDAFKKSIETVFNARNIASVEALPTLCKGSGEGLHFVWRLVLATVEVIEEYIPEKDSENNYVGVVVGFDG